MLSCGGSQLGLDALLGQTEQTNSPSRWKLSQDFYGLSKLEKEDCFFLLHHPEACKAQCLTSTLDQERRKASAHSPGLMPVFLRDLVRTSAHCLRLSSCSPPQTSKAIYSTNIIFIMQLLLSFPLLRHLQQLPPTNICIAGHLPRPFPGGFEASRRGHGSPGLTQV